jgi:hypothetical protein
MLSNHQRAAVMVIAAGLPDEKRRTFLERLSARLGLRGSRFTDADLDQTIQVALRGLTHTAAARP